MDFIIPCTKESQQAVVSKVWCLGAIVSVRRQRKGWQVLAYHLKRHGADICNFGEAATIGGVAADCKSVPTR